MTEVWIFNGAQSRFPSAVFEDRASAETWIRKNQLSGVLTKYPVGMSVYEWAIDAGHFQAKNEREKSPAFIQQFSSAAQEHVHFECGRSD